MAMTNYMELLMTNQPYNLIFFMVIPVALAEFLVATEFYSLYLKDSPDSLWHSLNRFLGKIAGIYFAGVFLYLTIMVVPHIVWRGWVDIVAVVAYLCGVLPLLGITLLEFKVLGRNFTHRTRLQAHFLLLIFFLVVSHVAMVFGMVNPEVTGGHTDSVSVHEHSHGHKHN